MKQCTKCRNVLPETFFSRNKFKGDGLMNRCKVCDNARARTRDLVKVDRESNRRYPEKSAARIKAKEAIKSGKLVRQPCEVCGDVKSQAHHDDYSKPLDVRWLCHVHHAEVHHGHLPARILIKEFI